jgi:hypothetical protein
MLLGCSMMGSCCYNLHPGAHSVSCQVFPNPWFAPPGLLTVTLRLTVGICIMADVRGKNTGCWDLTPCGLVHIDVSEEAFNSFFRITVILTKIIIIINCKWVDTRWQWSFYILQKHGL